ncbi:MAG: M20 family metallopeptidase [Bacteroidales bacterium]
MKTQIQKLADDFTPEIIQIRRALHSNPELSFKEYDTAELIEEILLSWNIESSRIADTGVTALIKGNGKGRYVVLRADMDALPITQESDKPYQSKNPGIMHGCGHDVHAASLLGTAKILHNLRHSFKGTVRLLFQPGEELLPGGALKILESGLLDQPKPDCIIAQHVYPELPAGEAGFRGGAYMASADEIYIEIRGIGGHGGLPHKLIDPVLIASNLVVNLQHVITRRLPAEIPAVLSFGKFDAPGATNVIPPVVKLEGTFRTFDETWRKKAHEEILKTAEGLVKAMGGEVSCRIVEGYPALTNDPGTTRQVRDAAVRYLGPEKVRDLQMRMTSEDFARYARVIPGVFYRLGTGSETTSFPVHHPQFDVDESALTTGMGLMAFMTVDLLGK